MLRTGCVLNRFESCGDKDFYQTYKVLTLKSITGEGNIDINAIESFNAKKEINPEYITKYGDVVVRLREPVTAVFIDESLEGLVVQSFCTIIKTKKEQLEPRYLQQFLNNSKYVARELSKHLTNTTISIIRNEYIAALEIPLIPMEKQVDIARFAELQSKEIDLLLSLVENKKIMKNAMIERLIKGE